MGKNPHGVLQDYVGFKGRNPLPTLQDLVFPEEPESFNRARTDAEDRCFSTVAGQSYEGHILEDMAGPIPYLYTPPSMLRKLHDDPETPVTERVKIERAMKLIDMKPGWAPPPDLSDVRDEDFNYPNPNAPQGNSVRKADPWSR